MHVHWLQHVGHETLGCIEPWLARRGHRVTRTRLHAGEPLPGARAFDWLVVMGGTMNIYEHEEHPWLAAEKELINDACVTDKKVLGICLGSQLVADVLGGTVTRNQYAEIGWFDVWLREDARRNQVFTEFPGRMEAFHWHGDTFALPPGATGLMSSEACANQAFSWGGGRVLGLQFHLEVTAADARAWLEHTPVEPQRYVQGAAEILRDGARFERANRLMHTLLDRLETL